MNKTFKIEVVETIHHYYTFNGEESDTAESIEEKFWAQVDEDGELPDSNYGDKTETNYDKIITIVTEETLQ